MQIAWNSISEFIQFINAKLQIKKDSKTVLLELNKDGLVIFEDNGKVLMRLNENGLYNYREDGTTLNTSLTLDGMRIYNSSGIFLAKLIDDGLYTYNEKGTLETSTANGGFHRYDSTGKNIIGKFVEDGIYLYDNTGKVTKAMIKNDGSLNISSDATIGKDLHVNGYIYTDIAKLVSDGFYLYDSTGKVTKVMLKNDGTLNVAGNGTIGGDCAVNGGISSKDSITSGTNLFVNNGFIKSEYTYDHNEVTVAPNMYISSAGNIRKSTNTSSKRYKTDIKDVEDEELNAERLYDLHVKQFKYKKDYFTNEKDERYDRNLIGFIAEEVEEVYPIACDYEEHDGQRVVENWNEKYIIPAMLQLIQKQHKEIEDLKAEVADIKQRIAELEKK